MKKFLRHFYVILTFVLIDAFIRSVIPNLRILSSTDNYDFWGFLAFHMVYFIAFQCWFYIPIAGTFYMLSYFLRFNRFVFITAGALFAYAHYLFYCFTTGDSIGSENFYIRSLQYILFGGLFGVFRYHMMSSNKPKSIDV